MSTKELEEVLLIKDHEELSLQFVLQVTTDRMNGRIKFKLLPDGFDQENFHPEQPYPVSIDLLFADSLTYATVSFFSNGKRATVEHDWYLPDVGKGGLFGLNLNLKDYHYDLWFNRLEVTKGSMKDKLYFEEMDGSQSKIDNVESFDIFHTPIGGIGVEGLLQGNEGKVMIAYLQLATTLEEGVDYDRYTAETIKKRQEILGYNLEWTEEKVESLMVSSLL